MGDKSLETSIKSMVSSLLTSTPLTCTLRQFQLDYKNMIGEDIPYRRLGYSSVEHFLTSIPDVVRVVGYGPHALLQAVVSEKTAHINELVMKQRVTVPKHKRLPVQRRRPTPHLSYSGHNQNTYKIPQKIIYPKPQSVRKEDSFQQTVQRRPPEKETVNKSVNPQITARKEDLVQQTVQWRPSEKESINKSVNPEIIARKEDSVQQTVQWRPSEKETISKSVNPEIIARKEDSVQQTVQWRPSEKETINKSVNPEIKKQSVTTSPSVSNHNESSRLNQHYRNSITHQFQPHPDDFQVSVNAPSDITSKPLNSINNPQKNTYNVGVANRINYLGKSSAGHCYEFVPEEASTPCRTLEIRTGESSIFEKDDITIQIPKDIQMNLKKLIASHPQGIWCRQLPEEYMKMFHRKLDYQAHNYKSLIAMCMDLPEIFHYVRPSKEDFKLYDHSKPLPQQAETTFTMASYRVKARNVLEKPLPELQPYLFKDYLPKDAIIDEVIPRQFVGDLKEGDYMEIVIAEIWDISKFWVYLHVNSLDELMDDLQLFYGKHHDRLSIPEVFIREGLYCVCKFYAEYHRGIIVKVDESPDVKVLFVDYGTTSRIPKMELCFLAKPYGELPFQSIRCRLANVYPARENMTWSKKDILYFYNLVNNRDIYAQINRIIHDKQMLDVYLFDRATNECINDILVKEDIALFTNQERTMTVACPGYKPLVKYLHLFPSFLDLEFGIAASAAELSDFGDVGLTFDHCYPQYFSQPRDDSCTVEDSRCAVIMKISKENYRKDCVFGSLSRHDLRDIQASRSLDLTILEGIGDDLGKILALRGKSRKHERSKNKMKQEKYNTCRKFLTSDNKCHAENNDMLIDLNYNDANSYINVDKSEKGVQVEAVDTNSENTNNIGDTQQENNEDSQTHSLSFDNATYDSEIKCEKKSMDSSKGCESIKYQNNEPKSSNQGLANTIPADTKEKRKINDLKDTSGHCGPSTLETAVTSTTNVNQANLNPENEIPNSLQSEVNVANRSDALKNNSNSNCITDEGNHTNETLNISNNSSNCATQENNIRNPHENIHSQYQQAYNCPTPSSAVYYQWSDPMQPPNTKHVSPSTFSQPQPQKVVRPPPGFLPRPPLQTHPFGSQPLVHPGMFMLQPPQPIYVFTNPTFLLQDGGVDFFSMYNNSLMSSCSSVLPMHQTQHP